MSAQQHPDQQPHAQPESPDFERILSGYRSQHGDTDYLRQVVSTDIGWQYLAEMKPEFEQANILANRNEAETYEALTLVRLRTNQFLMEHPPEGSKLTGSFRQLVYDNDNEPLSPAEVRDVLAVEQVLLARITQSRGMEQQKIIKEMRQDQTLTREDSRSNSSWKESVRNMFN